MDIKITNTWTIAGDDLNILSTRNDYDAWSNILGGYILNLAGSGCTIGGCASGVCSLAVKNSDTQYTADENVGKTNGGTQRFNIDQTYNINYCGDWEPTSPETVWSCHKDVCGTTSIRYNLNDKIGGASLAVGGPSATESTCGIGTGFTGNTEDWFEVTTSQTGILKVELTGPSPCDWDFWVYDINDNFKFSSQTASCSEQSSSELPAGTYKIKVKQWNGNGNGQGSVKVSLVAGTCTLPRSLGLGALNNYNDQITATTVPISSSMQDDIFKFSLNKAGYVVATLTSSAGIGIDGIRGPNPSNYCLGVLRCSTGPASGSTVSCNFYSSSLGEYGYDARWVSGSGTATVTATLRECLANNAVDGNCPLSKPYCTSNRCVECYSNDITYGDANTNNDRSSQCTDPAKPRCRTEPGLGQYTCEVPAACNTNADCIPNQCCTKEVNPTQEGICKDLGTMIQPFICAG